ncbi:hypothetical protein ACQEU3_44440 [Spirillospora sp. CA-253888]
MVCDTLASRFDIGVPYPRPFPKVEEIPAEAKRVVPRPTGTPEGS